MLERPNAVGLILCQQVITEENTRNVTLVNTLNRLRFASFPSPQRPFVVYVQLTDGRGEATMSLVVSRLDTLEDVFEGRWRMTFTDPLRVVRMILRSSNVSFPVPGLYQWSLFADGEWVAQSVLEVLSEEV
jgi:hypothetical protein